ncbi:MAG: NAD-dependent epimerase/dehydratase family protein [Candidatus Methanoperedens sp.]|nr:NAD-dependent epimerase/dehydratase family protein [Candidatus Methanoperedens sp.]
MWRPNNPSHQSRTSHQSPLPYGLSKLTGERYAWLYCGLYVFPVVCLRPFNIFSPRQNPGSHYSGVITKFIERIKNDQNPVIFGDGNQTRDFVYIEDVVEAIFNTMENKKANMAQVNPLGLRSWLKLCMSKIMKGKGS